MTSERTFSRSQHNKNLSSSLLVPSFLRLMLKMKRLLLRAGSVWEAGGGQVGTGPGPRMGMGKVWPPGAGHGYVIPSPAPPASRGKERFVFKKPTNNVCFRFYN